MGGRNEQANNRGNRSIKNVVPKRTIAKAHTVHEPPENTVAVNEADSNANTFCLGQNFIPLSYTNRSADVYPYSDSYEPLENVLIVSGATAYDHPNGEMYILIFHESLYYGTSMKHSLINPNQIRFNGLDFADNPMRDENLHVEMDKNLFIALLCKGTKLQFTLRVPTKIELHTYQRFEMTSDNEWNPELVNLSTMQRISNVNTTTEKRRIFKIQSDTTIISPTPTCHTFKPVWKYIDPSSDESILNEINPCLISLKELSVVTQSHDKEIIPARRTFLNKGWHKRLTAESLSELWHIGPKRARATIDVTTQYGIRSAIMPLSRRYRSDRMLFLKRLNGRFATDTFSQT